jgi:Tfp pilus assembly protein FimT
MLHDARMAGLAKLRRSIRSTDERQLRAVHVGRGQIVWQDRCDAADGSKEPVLSNAAICANVVKSIFVKRSQNRLRFARNAVIATKHV